jgi:two-component system, response regulator PdtaR
MPAIGKAPRANSGARSLESFSRHLAADSRSARPIAVATRPASSSLPTKSTKALRVLVVEDDAVIGVLLGEMLEEMGYEVCGIEATEADAVTAAALYKPDLMIVDVQLGEGSGVAAIDTIHLAGPPVPHVFVSGDMARLRALKPGSIAVRKPYRESELALVIQRALEPAAIS